MIFDGLCDVFRALSAELILGKVEGRQRPAVMMVDDEMVHGEGQWWRRIARVDGEGNGEGQW